MFQTFRSFYQEIMLYKALKHPRVVGFYNMLFEENRNIVEVHLEYVPGVSIIIFITLNKSLS